MPNGHDRDGERPEHESRHFGTYADLFPEDLDNIVRFFVDTGHVSLGGVSRGPCRVDLQRLKAYDPVYIIRITTDEEHRGQGLASQLLSDLCRLADFFQVKLSLEVETQDDSGLSDEELAEWYWRHEFWGPPDGFMVCDPEYVD